jgi:hypothetical protein
VFPKGKYLERVNKPPLKNPRYCGDFSLSWPAVWLLHETLSSDREFDHEASLPEEDSLRESHIRKGWKNKPPCSFSKARSKRIIRGNIGEILRESYFISNIFGLNINYNKLYSLEIFSKSASEIGFIALGFFIINTSDFIFPPILTRIITEIWLFSSFWSSVSIISLDSR